MNRKRLLCMGLVFVLLLSALGCAPAADADPTGTPGKVEDPFAQPTPTPAPAPTPTPVPTAPPATGAPDPTPTDPGQTDPDPADTGTPKSGLYAEAPARPYYDPEAGTGMGFGFVSIEEDIKHGNDVEYVYDENAGFQYRVYNGGEMRLPVMLYNINGYRNLGVGLLLFVDGIPQPYRVEGETEYSYMRTFYPEFGTYYPDLYFIPVTGQKGDNLEVWVALLEGPEVIPTVEHPRSSNFGITGWSSACRIQFNADPPAQELPETANRILSQTVSYADTTFMETGTWTADELRQKISVKCTTPDMESPFADRYNISADVPIRMRFEVYGSYLVDYRLVYFLDNVPVAVDPDDLALIEVEYGRKTVVETVIDLWGFQGYGVLYSMLVPRNRVLTYDGEPQGMDTIYLRAESTRFILTSASDFQGMLEITTAWFDETP